MFIIYDLDSQSVIGPFYDYTDAQKFISNIEDMSLKNVNNLEIFEMETPDDWTYNNLDDLLMSNY